MPDQANEFLKDYQAFAQQSWDAWMRYMQQQSGGATAASPFGFHPPATPTDDLLTRSLSSLKSYGNWLQQMASAGLGPMPMQMGNWQQPAAMQPFLTAFTQPFAQAVAGIDSASAFGFDHQWQSWLQAMQHAGMSGMPGQMAAFGLTREMQLDQQALAAAINEYNQASARYQALLQQVNTKGIGRLQDLLGQHAEPGKQIQSMKALYDLWVDAMEEAYAEMALSDEYRDVFGAVVNAQMQVRKLQRQQVAEWCRELGIPTRSEVDSLGQRLQQTRRELRERKQADAQAEADTVDALQAEVAALKRELAASKSSGKASAAVRPIGRKSAGDHHDKAAAATTQRAKATRSAAGKRK